MSEPEHFSGENRASDADPRPQTGLERVADARRGTTTVILDESHSARRRPMSPMGRLGMHLVTELPRILYALAALLATLGVTWCWAAPSVIPSAPAHTQPPVRLDGSSIPCR